MSATRTFRLPDAAATDQAGAALGRALLPGDVVMLSGPLGAGKSALARAALTARMADAGQYEETPSPTYTLVQSYVIGAIELRHADLYRLSDPEEAEELGLFEDLDAAILLIEWGERLGALAPARRLQLALGMEEGGAGRLLTVTAVGDAWCDALDALGAATNGPEERT